MRPCSRSMRKRRFKRSIASTRCCRCRPVGPSDTASSTTATASFRCWLLSTRSPAKSSRRRSPRHTSAAFVDFLGDIVATQPKRRQIHVIADNLSTHKTQAVRTFLLNHPNVHLHFMPTYSSLLNQVELWFAKIERQLLARGIFTSVADLARKIRGYIWHYNKTAKTVRWRYRNPEQ